MIVKQKLVDALNQQIQAEFAAAMQYIAIATWFDREGLPESARHFYRQADEERMHAMKIVQYLLDAGAVPRIPGVPEPRADFSSAEEVVKFALDQERKVTEDFNRLVSLAMKELDYTTNTFLHWFVNEQVEEVASMSNLLQIVRHAGQNLLFVEDYVRRNGPQTAATVLEDGA